MDQFELDVEKLANEIGQLIHKKDAKVALAAVMITLDFIRNQIDDPSQTDEVIQRIFDNILDIL